MGKTDRIKERRVDVYLDSLARKERWSILAEEADESLSTFVQQCVEYAIEQGGPDFAELGEESKKIQDLENTIDDLPFDTPIFDFQFLHRNCMESTIGHKSGGLASSEPDISTTRVTVPVSTHSPHD